MPNIKSAKKRVLVNSKKAEINKSNKSELKTTLKKLNLLLDETTKFVEQNAENLNKADAENKLNAVQESFKNVCRVLDKAASKGLIHKNTAANKKSGFALRINALKAALAK